MYLNRVQLIGYVGSTDTRYTKSGDLVFNFGVATTRRWKDEQGNLVEDTQWHKVVVFRKLAETMSSLVKKGMPVFVSGSLRTTKYQRDGVDVSSTEIVADDIQLLSKKEGNASLPENGDLPAETQS
jgi:single-strand DNA-binding protein